MSDEPRSRIRHDLKTWPEFFQATLNGLKKFELRRDDRPEGYQVGDELLLKEWDPEIEEPYGPGEGGKYKGYTGREVLVRVDYIMDSMTVDRLMNIFSGRCSDVRLHHHERCPGCLISHFQRR